MTEEKKKLTEKQRTAVDFFRREIRFSKEYDEEQRQKVAVRDAAAAEKITLNAKIGDPVPGGDVYAGLSPDTGERMYARPADEKISLGFNAAAKRAEEVSLETGRSYRVPTENELDVLFRNREKGSLKGTFNEQGEYPDGWYWSSTRGPDSNRRCQRFSDGQQIGDGWTDRLNVRLVRS